MDAHVEEEGSTIDEAIDKALKSLGIARDQAQVEILQDARRNLLGFGRQKARVRVSVRRPVSMESASQPSSGQASLETAEGADPASILRGMLDRMGVQAAVEAMRDEASGKIELRISSESSALLIGRHGQTLDAIEFLVNRMASREEQGSRVRIDAENYRERRRQELTEMAIHLAGRVKERGKPETTVAMAPRDRRTVHLALSNDPGIATRSLGQGHFRRVMISSARKSPEKP